MSRSVTIACVAILLIGTSLTLLDAQSASVPPMLGRLVATDAGHKLHVWCTGEGSPTVVLITGGGSFSLDWAGVQPAVAAKTRVCSYDRAGYAWSDLGPAPRGVGTSVAELHQVLARATLRPPYVLVGSSWGGLIARVFAYKHPDEVTGVVLVDTTPWGVAGVTPSVVPDDVLTNLDPRAEEEPPLVTHLPPDLQAARAWAKSRLPADGPAVEKGKPIPGTTVPGFLSLEYSEPTEPQLAISATTAGNRVPLGDTPLTVISAGRVSWNAVMRASGQSYADVQRAQIAEQASLAGLSRNSKFVVARASFHGVQFYEPEIVTNAILQLFASGRTGSVAGRP